MSNSISKIFLLNIIDWLYYANGQFGVDHIVIGNKIYWLDSKSDRDELYKLWKDSDQ